MNKHTSIPDPLDLELQRLGWLNDHWNSLKVAIGNSDWKAFDRAMVKFRERTSRDGEFANNGSPQNHGD